MSNKVNASHILVKTLDEANHCLALLKVGKPFEQLAAEKSICPSKKKGGSLGWFTKGMMVPEFEKACFSAAKGQVVGPVKTQFGYHIIKIIDTS